MKLEALAPDREHAVLLISDQRYLPAARFVAAQALRQASGDFDIVVMTHDCSAESQALFDPRVKVVDVEPDPRLQALTHTARKSTATYARLGAIERLRGIYRKVLYVDCDIWIGSRPIGRLFDLDTGEHEIAAVRDTGEIFRPRSQRWIDYKAKLGLPPGALYFNTGVMLIDVEKFCRAAIGADAIAYLASGRYRGPFHDQSALNAILAGRWLEISPLWNWTFAPRARITEKYDPMIIHFIGPNKPWRDRRAKFHPKYRAEMRKYLAASGEEAYVEPIPPLQQWRRSFVNGARGAAALLFNAPRDTWIDRYMASTTFADVEAGIVTRFW
jgi:lipopolysaccharide biosynthesis glycosyltransferase